MLTKNQILTLPNLTKGDVYVNISDKAGKCRTVPYVDFLKEIEGMPELKFLARQMCENISIYESVRFYGALDENGFIDVGGLQV